MIACDTDVVGSHYISFPALGSFALVKTNCTSEREREREPLDQASTIPFDVNSSC